LKFVSCIKFRCVFYEMMASENWEFDDFNTFETLGLVGEDAELNI